MTRGGLAQRWGGPIAALTDAIEPLELRAARESLEQCDLSHAAHYYRGQARARMHELTELEIMLVNDLNPELAARTDVIVFDVSDPRMADRPKSEQTHRDGKAPPRPRRDASASP